MWFSRGLPLWAQGGARRRLMQEQATRHRRSPREWGVRLVLAGVVGWIGYLSVIQSVALVLPDNRIEKAYALAPNNGRIAGRLSQTLYRPDASEADRTRAVAIARKALRYDRSEHT